MYGYFGPESIVYRNNTKLLRGPNTYFSSIVLLFCLPNLCVCVNSTDAYFRLSMQVLRRQSSQFRQ